jgi:hypothetical protein
MSVISRIFTKLIGEVSSINGNTKSALLRVNDIDISEPLSITFSSLRTRTLTDASYSTSGTFTITGGSYALFAEAVSQSTATVTVLTTINGVTKNANRASAGTSQSTQIILGPGTYPYTFDIDVNSGTGSGGIVSIAI